MANDGDIAAMFLYSEKKRNDKKEIQQPGEKKKVPNQKAIDPNVSCFSVEWVMLVSTGHTISDRSSLLLDSGYQPATAHPFQSVLPNTKAKRSHKYTGTCTLYAIS